MRRRRHIFPSARNLDFRRTTGNDAAMTTLGHFALAALLSAGLQAQSTTNAAPPRMTIAGFVTDSTGHPLVGAEVRLVVQDTAVGTTRTDEDGRFALTGRVEGRSRLHARRVGFKPRDLELFFPRDSARSILIQLESAAQDLAAAEVLDSSGAVGGLRDFHLRRQSNRLGHYFTRQEIGRRQPLFLSEMLRGIPGVLIAQSRTGGFVIRTRGCRYGPVIWIDGTRAPGSELDELARADDVGGMEVYTTPAGVPAQYLDRSNVGCGTILVWTRVE